MLHAMSKLGLKSAHTIAQQDHPARAKVLCPLWVPQCEIVDILVGIYDGLRQVVQDGKLLLFLN